MDQLEEAERDLTDETKEIYRRVVKHKGEDGMAVAEGGCCGGCHQQFTGKMLSQLLAGNVAMCRSCGRLIYEPEAHSQATATEDCYIASLILMEINEEILDV